MRWCARAIAQKQAEASPAVARKLSGLSESVRTRVAQSMLTAAGYHPGPVDGVLGPLTRAAIRAFQRDHELPTDGEISTAILVVLVTQEKPSTRATTAPSQPDE